jgi:hypothetical protein
MMPTIRVAERTGRLEALKDNRFSADYEDELERVLRGLFNACPDCTSDAWEEVAENFDDQIGRDKADQFCRVRGYDIRLEPGSDKLVQGWRDIGIMLMARDRGLIAW